MLDETNFENAVEDYVHDLKVFFYNFGLRNLLEGEIDHIAIKARDSAEYEKYQDLWLPKSKRYSIAEINERRLGTAELYEPINISDLGSTETLEIIEPRPKAIVTTMDMIDHIEIRNSDFELLMKEFDRVAVDYEPQGNGYYESLVVIINNYLQEVKFTNSILSEIIEKQLAKGESRLVK